MSDNRQVLIAHRLTQARESILEADVTPEDIEEMRPLAEQFVGHAERFLAGK